MLHTVQLVVQRYRSCRLLIDGTEWREIPQPLRSGNSDKEPKSKHCGLLLYVSFGTDSDRHRTALAADSCLNLPVLTNGMWGDGVSEIQSIRDQIQRGIFTSVTVVPQANLICKSKSAGKSLQYHGQVDKSTGEELYHYFCNCIRSCVYEAHCKSTNIEPAIGYVQWKHAIHQSSSTSSIDASVPASQMYRKDPQFASFDEQGIPLSTNSGDAVTKSATKKLRKGAEQQAKKHAKWLLQQESHPERSTSDGTAQTSSESFDWQPILTGSLCAVQCGSFGMRQGIELDMEMGPFCHLLSF